MVDVEDGFEVTVSLDEAGRGGLEVGFGELGFEEQRAEGEVDLGAHLHGAIFLALRDPSVFAAARLDPEIRTVAWPNGADFTPEFLHSLLSSGVTAA